MLETSSVGVDTAVPAGDLTASLQSENAALRARLESRDQRIRLLEEALRLVNSNKYGPSRERLSVAAGQNELFNEAEVILELCEATGVEPELKATPLREAKVSKGKPGRTKLAAHLPRVDVRHELPESERHCDCGGTLVEIGADSSEQIDFVPARVQVLHHLRIKYACPGCEQCIKSAPLPAHTAAVPAGEDPGAPGRELAPLDPGIVDDRVEPAFAAAAQPDGRAPARLRLCAYR